MFLNVVIVYPFASTSHKFRDIPSQQWIFRPSVIMTGDHCWGKLSFEGSGCHNEIPRNVNMADRHRKDVIHHSVCTAWYIWF